MAGEGLRENLLLGLGNPLLDITANTDVGFLEKYDLKPNNAILAEEKHMPIYKDIIENYEVEYIAGGSCLNVMRVAQWILQKPQVVAFMGCIGRDKFGDILQSKATEAGVSTFFQRHDTLPTGTCAVVVTDKGANRSLCANLSAANKFSKDHIDIPENRTIIENAGFCYITGYFLIVSPESLMDIARHAVEKNKPFIMNISADYICHLFTKPLLDAVPYVDILIGNEQEALAFAQIHKWETENISEIALKICELPKQNKQRSRIAIITQESKPIIVAQEGKIRNFPVSHIKPEEIVDTNCAGDAFAGGFLAVYIQGKPFDECIKCGIYAATEVIKQSGCTFPEKPNF